MAVTRVHSSDSQVFVSGDSAGPLKGSPKRLATIQSLDISTDKDFTELQELGQLCYTNRILNSNQTTNVSLDIILTTGMSGIDPFYTFQEQQSGFLSTGTFGFRAADNAGESLISGAYLNSYNLSASVGEIVRGTISYEADTITFNADNPLTADEASEDVLSDFNVFQPADMIISTSGHDIFNNDINTNEGVSSSGLYIQSFSIDVSVGREAKNRIGSRIPSFRYPTLPANGDLSVSVIKNQVTGLDLSSLVLETGHIKIDLQDDEGNSIMDFIASGCSLTSLAESTSLDDNTTIDFSYTFSIKK